MPYLSFPQERQHRGRSLPFSDERTEWWGPGMLPSAGFTAVSGELVISARHCPSWAGVHRMVAVFLGSCIVLVLIMAIVAGPVSSVEAQLMAAAESEIVYC